MQILVDIEGNDSSDDLLLGRVRDAVALALQRYGFHIYRAAVLLSQGQACGDETWERRCRIEVWLRGCQPLGVDYATRSLELAVDGALYRLTRIIDSAHEGSLGQTAATPRARRQEPSGLGAAT